MAGKKFSVQITADECKGCYRCLSVCPKKLITKGRELNIQGYFAAVALNPGDCIGCGSCYYQCPEPGAITIYEESED